MYRRDSATARAAREIVDAGCCSLRASEALRENQTGSIVRQYGGRCSCDYGKSFDGASRGVCQPRISTSDCKQTAHLSREWRRAKARGGAGGLAPACRGCGVPVAASDVHQVVGDAPAPRGFPPGICSLTGPVTSARRNSRVLCPTGAPPAARAGRQIIDRRTPGRIARARPGRNALRTDWYATPDPARPGNSAQARS